MSLCFEERASDSPFVERVWNSHSEYAGSFTSISAIHWEMVVSKFQGKTTLTVRGPETKATYHDFPAEAEWVGIDFKLGAFMPHLPPAHIIDLNDVTLPKAASQAFWLQGSTWEFPTYDNADSFVKRLVREELLIFDPVVRDVRQGHRQVLSIRSLQYHYSQATGLAYKSIEQIERARYAAARLEQGMSIPDVVHNAGYFDQPHLIKSLKRFIGHTPPQIVGKQLVGLSRAELDCVFLQDFSSLTAL
jgi:AraC-like DNA-binding protein